MKFVVLRYGEGRPSELRYGEGRPSELRYGEGRPSELVGLTVW
jgi:hypothetical protein